MDAGLGTRLINNYMESNVSMQSSFEKLSTGNRINSASDDPAGLAISEKMNSQINGLEQGMKNMQDGISMIQVAEGAIGQIGEITQRLNELAIQSANGTLNDSDRSMIQKEADALVDEISKIIKETNFNNIPLFSKENNSMSIQFGANAGENQIINMPYLTLDSLGLSNFDLSTQENAQKAIESLKGTLEVVNKNRAEFGAYSNRFDYKLSSLGNYQENLINANSRIKDVDFAKELIEFSKKQLKQEASMMVLSIYKENLGQKAKLLLQ